MQGKAQHSKGAAATEKRGIKLLMDCHSPQEDFSVSVKKSDKVEAEKAAFNNAENRFIKRTFSLTLHRHEIKLKGWKC